MALRSFAVRSFLGFCVLASTSQQVRAEPTTSARKESKISARAREHFAAGVAYIDDPSGSKWEEAYKEFHAAYAESQSFRILNNIGLCALHLERDEEAIAAYEQYLALGGKDVSERIRGQVEKDIVTLKTSLVRIHVIFDAPGVSLLDERETATGGKVVNRYTLQGKELVLGIHPGYHRVTATDAAGNLSVWAFDAEPGTNLKHEYRLQSSGANEVATPATERAKELRVVRPISETPVKSGKTLPSSFYFGVVATSVFATTAAVTGSLTLLKRSAFNEAKSDGNLPKARELKDSGERLALVTDVALGAAVLSAGVAAYAYWFAPRRVETARATGSPSGLQFEKSRRIQLIPFGSANAYGVNLSGQF